MLLPPTSLELSQLLSALTTHLPTWAHIPTSEIKVTTLNGLSNKVILASLETYNEKSEKELRIWPANTVIKLKNKKTKNHPMKAFSLTAEKTILANQYGPKVLYDDENFQITEYIRSRELTVADYKEQPKRAQVAACIAKFTKMIPKNDGQGQILGSGQGQISLNSEP
jgi:hypothetical protein